MTDEDIIDCIMEVDKILSEADSALDSKNYKFAHEKIKLAREAIEELKEEDCAEDSTEVEMNIMNELK